LHSKPDVIVVVGVVVALVADVNVGVVTDVDVVVSS